MNVKGAILGYSIGKIPTFGLIGYLAHDFGMRQDTLDGLSGLVSNLIIVAPNNHIALLQNAKITLLMPLTPPIHVATT